MSGGISAKEAQASVERNSTGIKCMQRAKQTLQGTDRGSETKQIVRQSSYREARCSGSLHKKYPMMSRILILASLWEDLLERFERAFMRVASNWERMYIESWEWVFSSYICLFLIVKLACFVEAVIGLFHVLDCVCIIFFFILAVTRVVSKRSCGGGVLARHPQ